MSSPPPKPSEVVDKLLSERAKNTKSKETIKWLLERKTSLSSIFEADDDKYDDEAFEKALLEVMIVDRDNLPDQQVLNVDREDEWKFALERIKMSKEDDMKSRLEDLFCTLPTSQSARQRFSYAALCDVDVLKAIPVLVLAKAIGRAQEAVKNDKKKMGHLKSLHALITDLAQGMTDCVSIQAYLSVIVFLFWAANDTLDFLSPLTDHEAVAEESLIGVVQLLFRNYVALVLLVELKAKRLNHRGLWLDIPSEELETVLTDRLGPRNDPIRFSRKIQLSEIPMAFVTGGGEVDAESLTKVLAKMMVIDNNGMLVLADVVDDILERKARTKEYEERTWNRDAEDWEISNMDAKTIMDRLLKEQWVQPITENVRFVSDDLLLPASLAQKAMGLAKFAEMGLARYEKMLEEQQQQAKTAKAKEPKQSEEHERLTWIYPFIIDVGHATRRGIPVSSYLTASLRLFWGAADLRSFLPSGDSFQEARDSVQIIARDLLRNYLALVLIGEYMAEYPITEKYRARESGTKEVEAKESVNKECETKECETKDPEAKEPKGKEPEAKDPETKEPEAKEPGTGQSGTGDSGTGESGTAAAQSVQKDIRRKPVGEGTTRETGESSAGKPGAGQPNAEQSDAVQSSTVQTNAEQARAWQSTVDWKEPDRRRRRNRKADPKRSICVVM